jgi:hypothetical protein
MYSELLNRDHRNEIGQEFLLSSSFSKLHKQLRSDLLEIEEVSSKINGRT